MTKQAGTDTQLVIIKVGIKYLAIDTELNTYTEVIRATADEEGKWWDKIVGLEIVPEEHPDGTGGKLVAAFHPTVYRATKVVTMECFTCKGRTEHTIDAEWATGETLPNGYTPSKGELIKNHVTKCSKCGDAQYS